MWTSEMLRSLICSTADEVAVDNWRYYRPTTGALPVKWSRCETRIQTGYSPFGGTAPVPPAVLPLVKMTVAVQPVSTSRYYQ